MGSIYSHHQCCSLRKLKRMKLCTSKFPWFSRAKVSIPAEKVNVKTVRDISKFKLDPNLLRNDQREQTLETTNKQRTTQNYDDASQIRKTQTIHNTAYGCKQIMKESISSYIDNSKLDDVNWKGHTKVLSDKETQTINSRLGSYCYPCDQCCPGPKSCMKEHYKKFESVLETSAIRSNESDITCFNSLDEVKQSESYSIKSNSSRTELTNFEAELVCIKYLPPIKTKHAHIVSKKYKQRIIEGKTSPPPPPSIYNSGNAFEFLSRSYTI